MAVIQADSRTRIVALPPVYLLGLIVAGAASAGWFGLVEARRLRPFAVTALLWLPYVPGHVPSAFLIWQGPIEVLVWLAVAVGVTAEAAWTLPPPLRRLTSDPAVAPWVAGTLAAALFIAGSVALSQRLPNGDEPHYLMITQSLIHDRDLQIQNNHDLIQYETFWPNKLEPHYVARGLNGQIYSVHSPGVAVMVLPAFGLFGYQGAQATIIAAAAVTAGLVWWTAWLLSASAMAAWLAWAALSVSAPFVLHAFTVFPDAPGALCVAVAVVLLIQLEYRGAASVASVWVAGAALAAMPWLHSRFSLLAIALGLVLGLRLIRQRPFLVGQFLSIPLVSAVAWFGYFWTIWGTVNPAAPYGALTDLAWAHTPDGVLGLLLDQRYGLLATAPGYVCGIAGLGLLARQRPRLVVELTMVIVPYVVAASSYGMWWGGFGGPARFLVAILPIAAVPVAWLWVSGGPVARALTLLPLLTGAGVLAARLWADAGAMAFAETFGSDPVAAWAAPSVDLPAALVSLASASRWRDGGVWIAIIFVTVGAAYWLGRRLRLSSSAAWELVATCAALTLMLGATATWQSHHGPGIAPVESQLAFLRVWNPQAMPTDVQWRRPYRVSPLLLMRRIDLPVRLHDVSERPRKAPADWVTPLGAADYSLVFDDPLPRGEVEVRIGDTTLPLERWRLDGMPSGPLELPLRLPVPVTALRIYGDEAAIASLEKGHLRLAATRPSATRASARANRAARFGEVRTFFLDDLAYPEPSGFWTRGAATTELLLDHGGTTRFDRVTVTLQSGPVATTVDVLVAGEGRRVQLTPNQRSEVVFQVADADAPRPLSIRSSGLFRPVQHDAKSGDFRPLGVWVELR